MSIASWYHTRALQSASFVARTGSNAPQAATAMANANQTPAAGQQIDLTAAGKDKKSSEPLFGPSIGSVSSGPAWTFSSEKKVVTDELTPDIVSTWIEKSKEPSQPTTTLQALVNLKRPTLRLSPLTAVQDDSTPQVPDQHHHGLEFEYDCDAPKCGIYVHVYLPKTHPDAPSTSTHHPLSKLLVFETVVDGGFNNHLKLEEGALLELGRFGNPEGQIEASTLPPVAESSSTGDLAATDAALATQLGRTTISSSNNNQRRLFTNFHFRKRSQNHSISGPALAVVDAEPAVALQENGKAANGRDAKDDAEEGVRVTIRLAALDEQGTELASPNEQITYLHIVRFGQKVVPAENADGAEGDGPNMVEDMRPWVVKVVKREATIGPHTFHLHEIFGLTSASSHNAPPTAPPPAAANPHTYPPDESGPAVIAVHQADDEDPQSECLLCLSSPREVVLLPCRHLVACKECALNMVEFGAGGNITQAPEPVTGAGGDEAGAGGVAGTLANPTTAATPANPRRKRKAKGWFCPVCRQPYASMLRLTTTAPPSLASAKGLEGTEDDVTVPELAHTHGGDTGAPGATSEVRGGGLLGGGLRPGFLRGLSLARGGQAPAADVENQNGPVVR